MRVLVTCLVSFPFRFSKVCTLIPVDFVVAATVWL